MKLLTIIPTYNEIDNIERFIKAVFNYIPQNAAILVVDDNSPDGTAYAVEKMYADYSGRLHILNRPEKQGLAAAYLAGFLWGWNGPWDVFLEIDADFSHDPKYIPVMLEQIQTHDVVIGSRNIKGGGVEGWSFVRNAISKGGSLYSRLVLGCPIRDLTGGFNMWRKSALEKINLASIISKGYLFQVEMKYKTYRAGCPVKEIPIVFTDRKQGKSKMSKKIFFEALLNIWKIRNSDNSALAEFFKFAVTGGLGTVTNLVIFFLCADLLGLYEIPVSIGCLLIAATQNYFINHFWSFRKMTASTAPQLKKWTLFICFSLAGLAINLLVMKAVLAYWKPPYKVIAQGAGIAAGMLVNFVFSKHMVFKNRGAKNETTD
ncbi:MAG: glycosyltransferase family 2 protein [Treponema sp.]|jgi:dolichol-phosphate mannosyltransferase|nr:glycosyltransferase family 2 protein [Treponema sp.]